MTTADDNRMDSAAIKALYDEHVVALRAFLTGVLRSSELASDALQATFATASSVGHTAREQSRKGWLFRVAFNEAMAIRRREKQHGRSLKQLASNPQRDSLRPEEIAIRQETIKQIREALDGLPDEQRRVVRMRIYEEKTFAVIAETLDLPLGTVLTRMRLALGKLAKTIGPRS